MRALKEIRRTDYGLQFTYEGDMTIHVPFGDANTEMRETFAASIFELDRRAKFFEPPPRWKPEA